MPPPRGFPNNPVEGPGDYDVTTTVHSDTYPAIDSAKANLSGKAVFITGASKGLGLAISVAFAKAGASYLAIGARSDLSATEKAIQDAANAVGKPGPKVLPLKFDLTSLESVNEAAAAVKKEFGRCDIVINNAGVLTRGTIIDSDPEEWWSTWTVNLRGPYYVAKAFLPLLLQSDLKTIVTVSSVGAHCYGPGLSAYQPSKLAVLRFAEFIAAEYGEQGVISFCIHPGNIPTDIVGGKEGLSEALRPSA
ncbi:MAG: hypothetical protein M1820_000600 [Bogoriella megaspora]|nr:MAG: hypothetical protein M1820_000600 [Bogoriella megaspora]